MGIKRDYRCNTQKASNTYTNVSIAGTKITIYNHYLATSKWFNNYIATFAKPDLSISYSYADIIAERQKDRLANSILVQNNVAVSQSGEYYESAIILQKLADSMLEFNTLLVHGSVVALNNQAYMFTAPSGVGKSTRTKLWLDLYPGSIVVNGDKPFIKITDTEIIACGTPWCGKEGWNTNTMVPIKAIFILERIEQGENSSVEEVSLGRAFPSLLQQIYHPEDSTLMRKTLSLLKDLDNKVKIYKFRSAPTLEAVRLAFETANRDN